MQRYFDATYLGKLHWVEPGSPEVVVCAAAADELVCALHGWAEFCSIGHRKLRESLATPAAVRAADALHLATAAAHGFIEIHSNDRHLLAAAPLFGLAGVNVIP